MQPADVLITYDAAYASDYDQRFLELAAFKPKTEFELRIIQGLTATARTWLDVACGTGYFLRHGRGRPGLICTGLDLSPDMIAAARRQAPFATFLTGNFLNPWLDFKKNFDVVTCMWLAYGLLTAIEDIFQLIQNLHDWCRPGGVCFMPLMDPEWCIENRHRLPTVDDGMEFVSDEGSQWNFWENGCLTHQMYTPAVDKMVSMFIEVFDRVQVFDYPPGYYFKGLVARRNDPF